MPSRTLAFPSTDESVVYSMEEGVGVHSFIILASPTPLPTVSESSMLESLRTSWAGFAPIQPDSELALTMADAAGLVFDGDSVAPLARSRGVRRRDLASNAVFDLLRQLRNDFGTSNDVHVIMFPVVPVDAPLQASD